MVSTLPLTAVCREILQATRRMPLDGAALSTRWPGEVHGRCVSCRRRRCRSRTRKAHLGEAHLSVAEGTVDIGEFYWDEGRITSRGRFAAVPVATVARLAGRPLPDALDADAWRQLVARRSAAPDRHRVGLPGARRPVAWSRHRHCGDQSRCRYHRIGGERASARRRGTGDGEIAVRARRDGGRHAVDRRRSRGTARTLVAHGAARANACRRSCIAPALAALGRNERGDRRPRASRSCRARDHPRCAGVRNGRRNRASCRRSAVGTPFHKWPHQRAHRESPCDARRARFHRRRRHLPRQRITGRRHGSHRHSGGECHLAGGEIPRIQPAEFQPRRVRRGQACACQGQGVAQRIAESRRGPLRLRIRSQRDARRRRRRQRVATALARHPAPVGRTTRYRRRARSRRTADLRRPRTR